jgi:hypothetical protein
MKFGDIQEHCVQIVIYNDRVLIAVAMMVFWDMSEYVRRVMTHQRICCLHVQGAL